MLADIPPRAAKTGALGDSGQIEVVAQRIADESFPLVVDPVMISKHGTPLLNQRASDCLKATLLPHAFLLTPNLPEASALTGMTVSTVDSMIEAAKVIADLGPRHVLVKGGHLDGDALDILYSEGIVHRFPTTRIDTPHTHGTGCVLSAAITARLARGETVLTAVEGAKQFVTDAIRTNPGLGFGLGPVNLHARPREF